MPNPGLKRPDERTIALAVSIVRSKPEGLTVREYIRLLSKHVARGRRENAISSVYRHLDRSSYWRSEYERLKDEMRVTEGETIELKKQVNQLKAKLESFKQSNSTKKRKKPNEDVILVPRSPKKAKRDISSSKAIATSVDMALDSDFTAYGDAGTIIMSSLYHIQAILKGHDQTEPPGLAQYCVRAASAIPQILDLALQRHGTTAPPDLETLKAPVSVVQRSMHILMLAFNRLSNATDAVNVQNHVVYALVLMLSKLLAAFSDASLAELETCATSELLTDVDKKRPPPRAKTKSTKSLNVKINHTLDLLARCIGSILDLLDPKIETHRAVSEGFTYFILEKLGCRLYTLVFGHQRRTTMQEEIKHSGQPGDSNDSMQLFTPPEDITVRQAKLEAPYLVHLLHRIMIAAPMHLGGPLATKTDSMKATNKKGSTKGSTKGALTIVARERLQQTLVNCLFGTEGVDEDDPFMDCLKMPEMSGVALPMPKVKEADVQEWFKEEVWRILGWEILSREKEF